MNVILARAGERVCVPRDHVFPRAVVAVDRGCFAGCGDAAVPAAGVGDGRGTQGVGGGGVEASFDYICMSKFGFRATEY